MVGEGGRCAAQRCTGSRAALGERSLQHGQLGRTAQVLQRGGKAHATQCCREGQTACFHLQQKMHRQHCDTIARSRCPGCCNGTEGERPQRDGGCSPACSQGCRRPAAQATEAHRPGGHTPNAPPAPSTRKHRGRRRLTQVVAGPGRPRRLFVLALPLRQCGTDDVQQHSGVLAAIEAERKAARAACVCSRAGGSGRSGSGSRSGGGGGGSARPGTAHAAS